MGGSVHKGCPIPDPLRPLVPPGSVRSAARQRLAILACPLPAAVPAAIS